MGAETERALFVLRGAVRIPGYCADPDPAAHYDPDSQLWRWNDTRQPVVDTPRQTGHSDTRMTCTTEGIDQAETARPFGETRITETQEGADQSESTSQLGWGETRITRSTEGMDQSEGTHASFARPPFGLAD